MCGHATRGGAPPSPRAHDEERRAFERFKRKCIHFCAPKFGTSLWRETHRQSRRKRKVPLALRPGQNLSSRARASALFSRDQNLSSRVRASALFSRGRLVSEASLPVFQRGWGRTSLKRKLKESILKAVQPRPPTTLGPSQHASLTRSLQARASRWSSGQSTSPPRRPSPPPRPRALPRARGSSSYELS